MAAEFTDANALSTLISTESLLLAALALSANFIAPARRIPKLPLSPAKIGAIAVATLIVVAAGAAAAWAQIFTGGHLRDASGIAVAAALLTAIVVEPVLAVLLGLGLRSE